MFERPGTGIFYGQLKKIVGKSKKKFEKLSNKFTDINRII